MTQPPGRIRDLMDQILEEGPAGRFRQVAVACFSEHESREAGSEKAIEALIAAGWLLTDEAALAVFPVQAAFVTGQPNRWPVYLALGLERVGVPLRQRGAFQDDPSLAAAVAAAAARNP